MRALITGSGGFLGRHFVAALRGLGWFVDRCDMRHRDALVLNGDGTYTWGSDCRYLFAPVTYLAGARIPDPYDLVIHCAALVDGRETIENKPALLGAYNLQLDGALFEWALRTRPGRVVYFSSSAAYPAALQNGTFARGGLTLTEDYAGRGTPDSTYGLVKMTGERIAEQVRKAGVPVTIVRPFSGYGADQDERYPFRAMIERAKRRDDPFVVWGDGSQVRDFVHVDDIVGAVLALVDAGVDGPVNIGTGVGTSMTELARLCMRAAEYDAEIEYMADKPSGVQYRVADTTRLREFYTPRVSIEEGVRRAMSA